ncbi:hypothetical protein MPTK1_3g04980 [Marchantia polymorpha subsp. ruderalis]|uniref:Uncharacterized protein n=2 Tax=Marchantia polymorpha TaxID=3197 RepID=A0AAF6AXJ4_MARPO|nr:hypothetical protein MARPO_0022s0031 [Marchantia polymorpha]BBN04478.1 hypothetical protein Mp_3g04980 [Marchantia polymorpha subsp. ruderalis]|eukprot:PTQ43924.1 hypothetical protein MARPO_0022s0031 [Marchantia polymorpha]
MMPSIARFAPPFIASSQFLLSLPPVSMIAVHLSVGIPPSAAAPPPPHHPLPLPLPCQHSHLLGNTTFFLLLFIHPSNLTEASRISDLPFSGQKERTRPPGRKTQRPKKIQRTRWCRETLSLDGALNRIRIGCAIRGYFYSHLHSHIGYRSSSKFQSDRSRGPLSLSDFKLL